MKNLFVLCWKVEKNEDVKNYPVTSNMKLANFGRISPQAGCSQQKQKVNTRPKTPEVPELPGQVLSNPDLDTNWAYREHNCKENDSIVSEMSIPVHDSDDDKKEIGVQAGSPLGDAARNTETTLTFIAHQKLGKNPWKADAGMAITLTNDKQVTAKELGPLKATPVLEKKNLEPVESHLRNKLPPVDKNFLLKLERENSNKKDNIQKINKVDAPIISHVRRITPSQKIIETEIDRLLDDLYNTLPREPIKLHSERTCVVKNHIEGETNDRRYENIQDIKAQKYDSKDDEMYDSDELDLFDRIDNEYNVGF